MKLKAIKIVVVGPDGKTLAEKELPAGGEPLLIGRSRDCSLVVGDASVSSRHARVFWKGGAAYLEDAQSRNGVYADGKRVTKPVPLDPNAVYAIGGCRLQVKGDDGRRPHGKPTLERVAGGGVGKRLLTIASSRTDEKGNVLFAIGLNPTNDLRLNDSLVSRQHAVIRVNSVGEGWLEDIGSVNGTYVNKEKLETGKPRLLKTGDRISIAYFEFVYRDGNAPTPPPIGLMLAVLAMLGLGVGGFYLLKDVILPVPDAEYYREQAQIAASFENFNRAEDYCKQADGAKKGSRESEINLTNKLRDKITRWKTAYESIVRLRDLLSRGSFETARQLCDEIGKLDFAFTWDTPETGDDARKMRDEFAFAARFIDVFFDVSNVLGRVSAEGAKLDELRRVKTRCEAELKTGAKTLQSVAYLQLMRKRLEDMRQSVELVLGGVESVDRLLNSIAVSREGSFSFRTVVAELAKIEANAKLPMTVRSYARSLLPVCRRFVEAETFLDGEKLGIIDMRLSEVRKGEGAIPLPSQDDCARYAKLSDARADLQKIHEFYQKIASNLKPMVTGLAESGIRDGEKGGLVTRTLDPVIWGKVLDFDCFSRDYPKPSRVDPTSVYDEIVGIEYTYNLLRELPKPPGRMMESMMHFTPKCQGVKQAVDRARAFAGYLDREETARFRSGKLGDLQALVKAVILDRDKLVEFLKQKSKTANGAPMGRKELVAGLFAEYLANEPTYGALRKLENGFRTLQKSINDLNEEYERLGDPEKRIAMRPLFLERGIPGMPIVRMIWGEMQPE